MVGSGLNQQQGLALTQGNTHVTATDGKKGDGVFLDCVSFECVLDGDLEITWKDGSLQTISLTAGWVNPIACKSVRIVTGTFNIGYHN